MSHYDTLIQQASRAVHSTGKTWHIERQSPATLADLDRCASLLGAPLPASYRTFLTESNGITLGIQLEPLVRYEMIVLGTGEIAERTQDHRSFARECFPEESFDGLIVFADTMDGDVCLFDRSQEREARVPVLGGNHEDDPDGWRTTVIAADFDQWYRNVLTYVAEYRDHEDFRYWWAVDWTVKP